MFKKAFTLAETLLVMAIIGIVATATIPNLMDSYQEDRDVAKLRGVYHDLEVAYSKAVAEYGPYDQWGSENYSKYLMKFLKATSCGDNIGICFPKVNMVKSDISLNLYTYELENGVGLGFEKPGSTSTTKNIFVALNGAKGKNNTKRAVFSFYINNDGVFPIGKNVDRDSNGKLKIDEAGLYTTNWVITNGNMDYLRCESQLNWTNQTSCP